MTDKYVRKTPQPREKSRPTKATAPPAEKSPLSAATWLPTAAAGFIAWGQAAERAKREFDLALRDHQQHRHDEERASVVDNARHVMFYTRERAYPPGFWEGMADMLAGNTEHLEVYIAFLEADLYFDRSGYVKSDVIRGLKRVPLTPAQRKRLQAVVLHVIDKGFRREFRDYCRLARQVQSPDWLQQLEARLSSPNPGQVRRARWVLDSCRRK